MARRIRLRSPLDPAALATRLKTLVPDTVTAGRPPGVIGRGSERSMAVWYHRPRRYNSLQTRLVATIAAEGTGSVIAGRIGGPPGGTLFLGCWLAFVVTFLALALLAAIGLGAPIALAGPMIGIPSGLLAFGLLFARLATRHARHDRAAILAWLADTIDARPI